MIGMLLLILQAPAVEEVRATRSSRARSAPGRSKN